MSDTTDEKTITAPKRAPLGLKPRGVERDTVRQSFSHGRTNTVQVERKKRRISLPGEAKAEPAPAPVVTRQRAETPTPPPPRARQAPPQPEQRPQRQEPQPPRADRGGLVLRQLSSEEIDARARALA